jgi:hypothetical protein
MVIGLIGQIGILVVLHVEKEIKHAPELVQTQRQVSKALIAVTPTLKLRLKHVMLRHVKK